MMSWIWTTTILGSAEAGLAPARFTPFGRRLDSSEAYRGNDACAVAFVRLQLLGKLHIFLLDHEQLAEQVAQGGEGRLTLAEGSVHDRRARPQMPPTLSEHLLDAGSVATHQCDVVVHAHVPSQERHREHALLGHPLEVPEQAEQHQDVEQLGGQGRNL